jgi:hypothetical protein
MEDGTEQRRKMAEQAEKGIAALAKLEEAVTAGEPNDLSLQELASWAENVPVPEDPELQKIVDAIRIRALVELAKRDRDEDQEQ